MQTLREIALVDSCCPGPSLPLFTCLVPTGQILPCEMRSCLLSWLGPYCWGQEAKCPVPAPPPVSAQGERMGGKGVSSKISSLYESQYGPVTEQSPWPPAAFCLGRDGGSGLSLFRHPCLVNSWEWASTKATVSPSRWGLVGAQADALPWRACALQRARCGGARDPAASWKQKRW